MAQLVEWSLMTPEIRGSNPVINCIKFVLKRPNGQVITCCLPSNYLTCSGHLVDYLLISSLTKNSAWKITKIEILHFKNKPKDVFLNIVQNHDDSRLTVGEDVDGLVVEIEEGLDAANPVGGWTVVAVDESVESEMLWKKTKIRLVIACLGN